jgi:hypothetical protein
MNRSIRIPLLSLGAALVLVVIGACGSELLAVRRGLLGVRRAERLRVAEPVHVPGERAVLRLQPPLRAGQGLPSGSVCLPGQNPANNQQDLFCFKGDAGRP